MNIALIGFGKMGKAISEIAEDRGHTISAKISSSNLDDLHSEAFLSSDVAIEFSRPESAFNNIKHCIENKLPVVIGTTGWLEKIEEVNLLSNHYKSPVFYASNFSIGMNITFAINEKLAKWMNQFNDYDVKIDETHHVHKLDSPSGTAISLAEGIISNLDRKSGWVLGDNHSGNKLQIYDHRIGEVPGTHIVEYKSNIDKIELKHEAFNRQGFALGAVKVAEWIPNKQGLLSMKNFLEL